jgi:hypothetical protein
VIEGGQQLRFSIEPQPALCIGFEVDSQRHPPPQDMVASHEQRTLVRCGHDLQGLKHPVEGVCDLAE